MQVLPVLVGPEQRVEFVAKRLLYGSVESVRKILLSGSVEFAEERLPYETIYDSSVLLGTPLYVALAD
jgi:hypothetical protein